MLKRVFLIHRWDSNPKSDWYPWLKKELEKLNFEVKILSMPNTSKPNIQEWVNFLKKQNKNLNKDTYFIGHSIGCQTILRYFENLPDKIKFEKVILIAPWVKLNLKVIKEEGVYKIAKPWLETKINWDKVKTHSKNFIAIFSNNDPYVTRENINLFKEKLNAKIILEKEKGHFTSDDRVKKLQRVIKELL